MEKETSWHVALCLLILISSLLSSVPPSAQDYVSTLALRLGTEERGKLKGIEPDVLFAGLDPVVIKWYQDKILPGRPRWKQWEYTNYAKYPYGRYISYGLWGNYFYDLYGNLTLRGWPIYDWTQRQPRQFGSSILQTGRYLEWFNKLIVASDSKGQYHYAITIGDEIRTVLTPMTFYKPAFNGIQWDFLSDEYAATLLLSRISSPMLGTNPKGIPDEITDNTNLLGGRVTRKLGDFVTVGATLVNAHQSHTMMGFQGRDFFKGSLSTQQNKDIFLIQIRLSDDSPEDGQGGAWLFSEDIFIMDRDGKRIRGKDIGFIPLVEGGIRRTGFLSADGSEIITLTYDFKSDLYKGPPPSEIDHVSFRLVLANDYKVEVTSDQQTNVENRPVFLTVARAEENVYDNTNQQVVEFDYGLPTANQIYGFTLDVSDVGGFSLQAELDFNRRYFQYPNRNLKRHHTSTLGADAWYVNTSYRNYPWFFFGEGFDVDDDYTTTSFLVDRSGRIDYEDEYFNLYEFVDDNDDHDRYPDWRRLAQGMGDYAIFPGWDENADFISDFNQNDNPGRRNLIPDYEEPFLRYSCDRPEFLFGMDMNNNGWIDRFENDNLADYPYKRGHLGYNLYLGSYILPGVRWTLGQKRQLRPSEDKKDLTTYGLFTFDRSHPGSGRIRIFDMIKRTKDNIPDDLLQSIQPMGREIGPKQQEVKDPLFAQNTWINTTFLGWDFSPSTDFNLINKIKYEIVDQSDSDDVLEEREARGHSSFLGVINKADYVRGLGDLVILPRWKSEFLWERPYLKRREERRELRETLFFVMRSGFSKWHKTRAFKKTALEVGVEITLFNQLREPTPPGLEDDFWGIVGLVQLTHWTTFMGYRFITQVGFRLNRQDYEDEPTRVTGTSFVTVFAGIQE